MEIIIHQAILHVLDTTMDAPVLSGSGKTTLILESLVPALQAKVNGTALPCLLYTSIAQPGPKGESTSCKPPAGMLQ